MAKAFAMGASDYLQKPFTIQELLARSRNLLRDRQLQKNILEDLTTGAAFQKKFLTHDSLALVLR